MEHIDKGAYGERGSDQPRKNSFLFFLGHDLPLTVLLKPPQALVLVGHLVLRLQTVPRGRPGFLIGHWAARDLERPRRL